MRVSGISLNSFTWASNFEGSDRINVILVRTPSGKSSWSWFVGVTIPRPLSPNLFSKKNEKGPDWIWTLEATLKTGNKSLSLRHNRWYWSLCSLRCYKLRERCFQWSRPRSSPQEFDHRGGWTLYMDLYFVLSPRCSYYLPHSESAQRQIVCLLNRGW